MEVKLAKSAGFCMGVRRAVDITLETAQREKGRRIYTYGPLIHNPQTIELFKSRGVWPVRSIDEIPDKKNSILIIRAHGIAPEERRRIKASGIRVIDCTCPKVGYVQAIIKKHALLGYAIVIVGDREHPEVDALLGYANHHGVVVHTAEEAGQLPSFERVCVVAQTTQTTDHYNAVVETIRRKNPTAAVFNTICSSTEERQTEVLALAGEMDAVFIVGGRNSANTKRLADLAAKTKTPTFQIETAAELDGMNLDLYEHVGISAGASTPNWIIDQVIEKIGASRVAKFTVFGFFKKLWIGMVRTDIYSAFGAACLCAACTVLQALPVSMLDMAVAAFFVYGMHVINRLIGAKPLEVVSSFREEAYRRHPWLYRWTAVFSLIVALGLSWLNSPVSFGFIFLMSAAGVLYNLRILPGKKILTSLRDLPGSKNVFMAAAWGMVTAVLPRMAAGYPAEKSMLVAFGFAFSIVFVRSAISDIMEMQRDKLIGHETLPVVIGKGRTKGVLNVVSSVHLFLLFLSYVAGWTSSLSLLLSICVLYMWICLPLCGRKAAFSGIQAEGFLETTYVIAGLCVLGWTLF